MHTRSQLQDLSRFPIRGVKPTHRFPSILLIACLVFATLLSLFFSPGDAGAATPKASESQIASTAAASTPTPSVCATSTPTPSLYAASTDIIPTVAYNAHVQDIGWQAGTELAPTVEATWFKDGKTAGTTGQSKRVEAFQVVLPASSVSGSVIYNAHVANIGWQCDTDDENTWSKTGILPERPGIRMPSRPSRWLSPETLHLPTMSTTASMSKILAGWSGRVMGPSRGRRGCP